MAEAHRRLTAPGAPFETIAMQVGGREVRAWKHAPPTNRDVLATARRHGERCFLVEGAARVSFDGFHRAVAALAHDLVQRGVRRSDRVAIAMRNRAEWPVAFYAALAIGAIAVPLNGWWTGEELHAGLADSGATCLIADPERLTRLDPARLPEVVYLAGGEAPGVIGLTQVIGEAADWSALSDRELPEVALSPDDPATICYTSGTSGVPKGAVASHRNMLCNIVGGQCAAARAALRRGDPVPVPDPAAPQAVAIVAVPFFHVTGAFAVLSPALYTGTRLVLMRRWDAGAALALVERERVSAIVGVPATAWQLLDHPDRDRHDLSSLVSLGYGGAAAAPELARRLRAELPAAVPGHGWGMTETSALATTHAGEDYAARPTSCGAPLPVMDLRVTGADGRVLPAGSVGELWARGPNVVSGYWNRPAETAATFVDGWLRTGDIARIDAEGFLHIVDRAKDVVIRGGENIYSVEVENRLFEHPAVIDAAVVALPDPVLGEVPGAVVTLAPGAAADEAALQAHVADALAAFKVPVRILFDREPLPRNANGKVLKAVLRERFGQAASAA